MKFPSRNVKKPVEVSLNDFLSGSPKTFNGYPSPHYQISTRGMLLIGLFVTTLILAGIGYVFLYKTVICEVWVDQDLSGADAGSIFVNDRPIIGILAQEFYQDGNYESPELSYIAASYVKFIEGAGGRAAPIMIGKSDEYYKEIFNGLNGILFPGGGVYFNESGYASAGRILLRMAREANDAGDYFPIWATCLGFEFLVFDAVGGKDVLSRCKAQNVTNSLQFTKDAFRSRLFGKIPSKIRRILETHPVTANNHGRCLTEDVIENTKLNELFSFLSWNMDRNTGLKYVSSMESKFYPIYGVQFHPEKNMYEWSWKRANPHSLEAIIAGQYFAMFYVNEARKSQHTFGIETESQYLIYNYAANYTGGTLGDGILTQKYFFPMKKI